MQIKVSTLEDRPYDLTWNAAREMGGLFERENGDYNPLWITSSWDRGGTDANFVTMGSKSIGGCFFKANHTHNSDYLTAKYRKYLGEVKLSND